MDVSVSRFSDTAGLEMYRHSRSSFLRSSALADYFKLPRPPLVDWDEAEERIGEGMLSYLRESRRMDNSRILKELEVKLKYPDLLAGLKECE